MKVLVLNCGSSSVKFQFFDGDHCLARGSVTRIGHPSATLKYESKDHEHRDSLEILDARDAIRASLSALTDEGRGGVVSNLKEIEGVGHRVVHGGEKFTQPTVLTAEVLAGIEAVIPLAPLHNPANLAGIRIAQEVLPEIPHVAVFDTAFHATMPEKAYLYALPRSLYLRHGVRRYGFHGTSHQFVDQEMRKLLPPSEEPARVITCHLGNGASVAAIRGGVVQDTSMGMTPLEGLVMGSRCGDLDASVVLYAMAEEELTPTQVNAMLNKHSGLYGLSGLSGDMQVLESAADSGDPRAALAIEVFCYRVQKYLGAYAAALSGLDALVFTGGIGENSSRVRAQILQGMDWLGLALDPAKNQENSSDPRPIHADQASVQAWVIPTNEEVMIARGVSGVVEGQP